VTAENDVAGFYARRIESLRASHRVAAQQWRRLANLRLVVFVLAAASVWWLVDAGPGMRAIPAAALVITLVLFAYLVTRSTRARTRVTRLADLVLIN
jgi:DMSO/TMAO reductase YedYZ heme-binding membrane subunit